MAITTVKKILYALVAGFLFSPLYVFADGSSGITEADCQKISTQFHLDAKTHICIASSSTGPQNLTGLITTILNWGLSIVGLIAVAFVIYGGFMYVTAASTKRNDEAKKIIMNALIGLVIVILAYVIVRVVVGTIGAAIPS